MEACTRQGEGGEDCGGAGGAVKGVLAIQAERQKGIMWEMEGKRGGREPFEYQTGCKFPSHDIYAKLTNEVLCAMEHFNLITTNQQLQRFLFVKTQSKRR